MISELERKIWRVETRISHTELGRISPSVGIGIIVLNVQNGTILLGSEPDDKYVDDTHSVRKDDMSIPTETRKKNSEFDYRTVQAGLIEEILRGTPMSDVQSRLFFMSKTEHPHFFPEAISVNGSAQRRGSLVVVMYDPHEEDVLQTAKGDLQNLAWYSLGDALQLPRLRSHTASFLQFFCQGRNPAHVVELYRTDYEQHQHNRVPIFSAGFGTKKFLAERNPQSDIYA